MSVPQKCPSTLFLVFFSCALTLMSLSACTSENKPDEIVAPPPAVDNRVLAIDVKEASDGDWLAALQVALDAGATDVKFSFDWNALESGFAGVGLDAPAVADLIMVNYPVTVSLILRPIDTVALTFPDGVPTVPLDNPTATAAFAATIDSMHARLPGLINGGRIRAITIGNEVDAYLGADAAGWDQFASFYDAARAHIQALDWGNPELEIGTIVTFGEMQNSAVRALFWSRFADRMSNVRLNYYPLQADFSVRAPDSPAADFGLMSGWFPGTEIVLQECGYPAAAVCGSSQEMQRQFIASVFAAWDTHGDQITHIDFAWLTDVAPATLDEWMVYYGMAGQPAEARFRGYLGTLGLREYDGAAKPALIELGAQARARGWVSD